MKYIGFFFLGGNYSLGCGYIVIGEWMLAILHLLVAAYVAYEMMETARENKEG